MPSRIEAARIAQQQWSRLSAAERVERMRTLRHVLAARMDDAITAISSDMGKPPLDALSGDVMVALEHMRWCEKNAERLLRPRFVGKPPVLYARCSFREIPEPYGVAAVFAPWNYPLQLSLVPAATALFAGNAVMLKCSEHTPRTSAFLSKCVDAAALPEGLLTVSCEEAQQATALVDAGPDMIFFTGSSANGRCIAVQAAERLIPCVLELGGNDACLVFASADRSRAVEGACYAAFANSGQVCVGAKRIFVEQTIFPDFVRELAMRASGMRVGTHVEDDIGPVAVDALRGSLAAWRDDALARGATLHTSSDPTIRPMVLTHVPREARLRREETFGPIVWLAPFESEADAIAQANDSNFALGASIFTADYTQAQRVASQLNAGSISINDAIRQVGNPVAAFGGNRASGYGRYHGAHGLLAFSRVKTVMTNVRRRGHERHWFPATWKTFRELRALLSFRHGEDSALRRWRGLVRELRGKMKPS